MGNLNQRLLKLEADMQAMLCPWCGALLMCPNCTNVAGSLERLSPAQWTRLEALLVTAFGDGAIPFMHNETRPRDPIDPCPKCKQPRICDVCLGLEVDLERLTAEEQEELFTLIEATGDRGIS
jgi:hypothetical protein